MSNKETKRNVDAEIVCAVADFSSSSDGPFAIVQLCAIMALHKIVNRYRREGIAEDIIIYPIIMKKIEFIKAATTESEIREIVQPPKIEYDGNKFYAVGPYVIPEEELILWSHTSAHAPLIESANKRYLKVFREVFPEMAKKMEYEEANHGE